MKRSLIVFSTFLFLLSACATPYKSHGLMGGYSDLQMAPDMFRVTFKGNGYTTMERAQDFTLLRASEVTLEHGFRYFAIMDESGGYKVQSWTTPGYSNTSGSVNLMDTGTGYVGSYNGSTTYTPPETHNIYRPLHNIVIKCFKEKPEGIGTFDGDFLHRSIKAHYKIQ